MDIKEFYSRQVSLSEWFQLAGHDDVQELRTEDNEKRERLKILNSVIGIPYDEPTQFKAIDLFNRSVDFTRFLERSKDTKCALRLIPLKLDLPKLRLRGDTVSEALKWFDGLEIDPNDYRVDFMPHSDHTIWSTIFVVNEYGIYGEMIDDEHSHLTQGFYNKNRPYQFSYNFSNWEVEDSQPSFLENLVNTINYLKVIDKGKQKLLKDEIDAEFINDYLLGYFETVYTDEFGLWFIDYNRLLGSLYKDFTINLTNNTKRNESVLHGRVGSSGNATGTVQVIKSLDLSGIDFKEGSILVCEMTTPEFVPLMKKASAILTEKGGVLSHAAIVARELGLPCIVGVNELMVSLNDGDEVFVDAINGQIIRI